jgi:hypothetical protein
MKLKTILMALVALITISTNAQTTLVRDKIEIKQSLKLTGKTVTAISTDSTQSSKSAEKLITEKAAKNYADSLQNSVIVDSSITAGFGLIKTVTANNIDLKVDSSKVTTKFSVDSAKSNIYGLIDSTNERLGFIEQHSTLDINNTSFGYEALKNITTGVNNTGIGVKALYTLSNGQGNTAVGFYAGYSNVDNFFNTYIGEYAGFYSKGIDNTIIGSSSGFQNENGSYNTIIGSQAMFNSGSGNNNTVIGYGAFQENNGNGNVVIGNEVGGAVTGLNNKLLINNSPSATYLINGDFSTNKIGINKTVTQLNTSNYNLQVGGSAHIAGSIALPYRSVTATYTIDATDYTVNCTSNTFTVNLPTAVGIAGRIYIIKNSGTSTTITVDANGTETIDGLLTQTITTPLALKLQSTGSGWIIL